MRTELVDRYRSLALPTTRDEHWRFTDLGGFDPDAWTADASSAVAVPSMLDLDVAASATITESEIQVRYPKRAHNPLLIAAGFSATDAPIPWLGGKRLRFVFG